MKKILAFAGSTSTTSINKQLATYAAHQLKEVTYEVVDLSTFEVPIFSVDEEKNGIPSDIQKFSDILDAHDGYIVSLAEHNGSYAAGFKNIFDWVSRIEKKVFRNKPVLLMATSPGGRGGANVLSGAVNYFPYMGASSIVSFSLPNFFDRFKDGELVNEEASTELNLKLQEFEALIIKS